MFKSSTFDKTLGEFRIHKNDEFKSVLKKYFFYQKNKTSRNCNIPFEARA